MFHFQNNLVLTNKDEEVSSADTLPLRLPKLKDLCLSIALAIPEWFDWTRVAWLPLLVKISRWLGPDGFFSNGNFVMTGSVTIESAAQKSANRTAQAILSGKYNKKLKEENLDDFIEVLSCPQTWYSM